MLHDHSPSPALRWSGRGTTGPGMGITFSYRACLLQLVEHPELLKPAAFCEGASHVRSRIVVAYTMVYIPFRYVFKRP